MSESQQALNKSLADLEAELQAAMNQHAEAERDAAFAQSRVSDAMNRLNAAQKALTDRITELQKESPWNSDWGRQRGGEKVNE